MESEGGEAMETSDEERRECGSLRELVRRRERGGGGPHAALLRLAADRSTWATSAPRGAQLRTTRDPWALLLLLRPARGFWCPALSSDPCASYHFRLAVGPEYPFEPPLLFCISPPLLHHPNICPLSGRVSMDLLSSEWSPIISLSGVIDALQGIMEDPVTYGPTVVNPLAAHQLLACPQALVEIVQRQQRAVHDARCWPDDDDANGYGPISTLSPSRFCSSRACNDSDDNDDSFGRPSGNNRPVLKRSGRNSTGGNGAVVDGGYQSLDNNRTHKRVLL